MQSGVTQVSILQETLEGQVETSESAGSLLPVESANYTTDFGKIERNVATRSHTPVRALPGPARGTVTFQIPLEGGGALASAPTFDLALRACGFRSLGAAAETSGPFFGADDNGKVVMLTVSSTTAWAAGTTLEHGTLLEGKTTATATFTVLGTYHSPSTSQDGSGKIFLLCTSDTDVSALTDTAVVDAATGTAVDITFTAKAVVGRGYHPVNRSTYYLQGGTANGSLALGDVVRGIASGARGVVMELPKGFPDNTDQAHVLVERMPQFGYFGAAERIEKDSSNGFTADAAAVQFDTPSVTISFYEDGARHRFSGCRGNVIMVQKPGQPGILEFSFQGAYENSGTHPGFTPTSNPYKSAPPRLVNANMVLDGQLDAYFKELRVDRGNRLKLTEDPTSANGFRVAQVTGRRFQAQVDSEAVVPGAYGFHEKAAGATGIRFFGEYGTAGTGDAFHFLIPEAQFDNVNRADDEGVLRYGTPLSLYGCAAGGDDEFTLFTY